MHLQSNKIWYEYEYEYEYAPDSIGPIGPGRPGRVEEMKTN